MIYDPKNIPTWKSVEGIVVRQIDLFQSSLRLKDSGEDLRQEAYLIFDKCLGALLEGRITKDFNSFFKTALRRRFINYVSLEQSPVTGGKNIQVDNIDDKFDILLHETTDGDYNEISRLMDIYLTDEESLMLHLRYGFWGNESKMSVKDIRTHYFPKKDKDTLLRTIDNAIVKLRIKHLKGEV